LAKETGGRQKRVDVTTGGEKLGGGLTDQERVEYILELLERVRQREAKRDDGERLG